MNGSNSLHNNSNYSVYELMLETELALMDAEIMFGPPQSNVSLGEEENFDSFEYSHRKRTTDFSKTIPSSYVHAESNEDVQDTEPHAKKAKKLENLPKSEVKVEMVSTPKIAKNSTLIPVCDRSEFKILSKQRRLQSLDFCEKDFSVMYPMIATKEEEERLDQALKSLQRIENEVYKTSLLKKISLQALEIQKLFGNTHYVFTHAQCQNYWASVTLQKELVKTFFPEKKSQVYKYLRMPQSAHGKDEKPLEITKNINDHNAEISTKLISVSASVFDAKSMESSLDFLAQNENIYSFKYAHIIKNCLRQFDPEHKVQYAKMSEYIERICKLNKKFVESASIGNLFVYCIPKKEVQEKGAELIYRSHEYGVPCNCHPDSDPIKILEEIQANVFNKKNTCNLLGDIPQYRLQIQQITPEQGSCVFALTPHSKDSRIQFKQEIRNIVQEFKKDLR